jgi:kynureninase
VSNPPILSAAPLIASLDLFRAAGIEELRAKSVRLTAYAERLVNERVRRDAQIITPADPEQRGAQLSIRVMGGHRRGRRVFDMLGDNGVVCDWREPDIIRITPVPFYNRFVDVHEFVDELAAALKEIT